MKVNETEARVLTAARDNRPLETLIDKVVLAALRHRGLVAPSGRITGAGEAELAEYFGSSCSHEAYCVRQAGHDGPCSETF